MLEARGARRSYQLGGCRELHALDGVDVTITPGATTALVGESGCGKSTLAKLLLRLERPDGGKILYRDQNLWELDRAGVSEFRRAVQMIFQDPYGSLNPRMKVGEIVGEPFAIHNTARGGQRRQRVLELLEGVGLDESAFERYPREFSGGQRQRIGIARALAVEPKLLIADEPVSALDVSVQAQILELLTRLREERGLGILFISHDLRVVRAFCDYTMVMYRGRIVEAAPTASLFEEPLHPYTGLLLESSPVADPRCRKRAQGAQTEASGFGEGEKGCPFHSRCNRAFEPCYYNAPGETALEGGRTVRCLLYE